MQKKLSNSRSVIDIKKKMSFTSSIRDKSMIIKRESSEKVKDFEEKSPRQLPKRVFDPNMFVFAAEMIRIEKEKSLKNKREVSKNRRSSVLNDCTNTFKPALAYGRYSIGIKNHFQYDIKIENKKHQRS